MHFLCLHGVGTNSKILELQTLAIRHALGPGHKYDFVEGGFDHPMEPSIASIVSPSDTFHAYFDPRSGLSMLETMNDLDELIAEADPPYDAVLGFSHGSSLAATMLTRPGRHTEQPPFKLAIFFSAGMAADHASLTNDTIRVLQAAENQKSIIRIPTVHVYAENDLVAPGQGTMLQNLCQPNDNYSSVHRLGHQIPGSADKKDLDAAVTAIKSAIKAVDGH
ncbi:serine hydrolase FSH [Xylaria telfairii]|nr:serine hydrolase FSH [Xylaria telfairii]